MQAWGKGCRLGPVALLGLSVPPCLAAQSSSDSDTALLQLAPFLNSCSQTGQLPGSGIEAEIRSGIEAEIRSGIEAEITGVLTPRRGVGRLCEGCGVVGLPVATWPGATPSCGPAAGLGHKVNDARETGDGEQADKQRRCPHEQEARYELWRNHARARQKDRLHNRRLLRCRSPCLAQGVCRHIVSEA